MIEHAYAIVLAGGGGTRLWPLSRNNRPKQFLKLNSKRSLFQLAIDRLEGLFPIDRIRIVTSQDQKKLLIEEIPSLTEKNFILEISPKGTAAAIALAALTINKEDDQAVMVILTADHVISNIKLFHKVIKVSCGLAKRNKLITLGINPTYDATGYGYIHRGELEQNINGIDIFKVDAFVEKPGKKQAKEFLDSGEYYWNSGMFIWSVNSILEEFHRQMPELEKIIFDILNIDSNPERTRNIKDLWDEINPQTIDYGIMENAKKVIVATVPDLGWSDIGSWDTLGDILPCDENRNIIANTQFLQIDSTGNLIISDDPNKLIIGIGIEDLIFVDTKDAILLCKRGSAQTVKKIVQLIKERGLLEYY